MTRNTTTVVKHTKGPYFIAILLVAFGLLLTGCTANEPYRKAGPAVCGTPNCSDHKHALIERHKDFDLAYVEFTERGNVFARERMQEVLSFVGERTRFDPRDPTRGVTLVVFVHGWKHNASADDTNVESFRNMLAKIPKLPGRSTSNRRLIGVYIGWRGLSVDMGPISNVTYWERKAAAEQVGKGGVTELLLRLERDVVDDDRPNRNLFLVTGHSFGGAIVLTALNEILLERVVNAEPVASGCVKSRPFGHGVVLLNPAIEANEALQLRELVAETATKTCFAPSQDRLMHVISSDADKATNKSFTMGQWLGVNLTSRQTELTRNLGGKRIVLHESDLDTTTVGNFVPFQTGWIRASESGDRTWDYRSCVAGNFCSDDDAVRIPVEHDEPLAFVRTDSEFIANHNDVFNDNVSAYLAAIVAEARHKRVIGGGSAQRDYAPASCSAGSFDFESCFDDYLDQFSQK